MKAIAKRAQSIESMILTVRGRKILIDADLAAIYEVQTRALNQAVRRNPERFPADFIFQLTSKEKSEVITNCDHLARLKFSKALPFAFTEHNTLLQHDSVLRDIYRKLLPLLQPTPDQPKRRIGFRKDDKA